MGLDQYAFARRTQIKTEQDYRPWYFVTDKSDFVISIEEYNEDNGDLVVARWLKEYDLDNFMMLLFLCKGGLTENYGYAIVLLKEAEIDLLELGLNRIALGLLQIHIADIASVRRFINEARKYFAAGYAVYYVRGD